MCNIFSKNLRNTTPYDSRVLMEPKIIITSLTHCLFGEALEFSAFNYEKLVPG